MKQIKFRYLATLGLCCSLLANSFTGITAIAETVTIESSPTAETVASEATTETEKKSAETEVKETKATETPTEESQEKKETTVVEVKEEESEEETNSESLLAPSVINIPKVENSGQTSSFEISKIQSRRRDYAFLAQTIDIQFMNEETKALMPATSVGLTANLFYSNNNILYPKGTLTGVKSSTNPNIKQLTVPAQNFNAAGVPDSKLLTYGVNQTTFTLPKFYSMSLQPSNTYTGAVYTIPKIIRKNYDGSLYPTSWNTGATRLAVSGNKGVYQMHEAAWDNKPNSGLFNAIYMGSGDAAAYEGFNTVDGTITYYIKNRRVTENFVDANGTKITPPTGFTQGKQTVIDSENFTYTQKGTLPYIYKVNNKPYVLKGWYKGNNKPAKLNQITNDNRNISYPVSYNDQDDVTVVYDELKLGDKTIQFGFVNEQGKYIPPTSKFNVSTDVGVITNATFAKLQTVNSTTKGNYLSLTIPAYNPTGGLGQGNIYYGTINSIVTIPKYYKTPTLTPSSNYQGMAYPTVTGVIDYHNNSTDKFEYLSSRLNLTSVSGSQTNYKAHSELWTGDETKTLFTNLYKMAYQGLSDTAMALAEVYAIETVNYYLENRRVTENFVDASGTKITPPTGFTQGKQTVIDSENFTYTSPKALPDTYKVGDKTYKFKGWYKGKNKPTTLETSKTPSYKVTYDDTDDLNVVYEEIEAFDFPALTYQFGFVDESGKRVDASTIGLTYDKWYGELLTGNDNDWKTVSLEKNQIASTKNNLKEITYPEQSLEILSGRTAHYSAANLTFTLPKYYEKISVYNKNGTFDIAYPFPNIQNNNYSKPYVEDENKLISRLFELKNNGGQSFIFNQTFEVPIDIDIHLPHCLRVGVHDPRNAIIVGTYYTIDKPIYYYLTNRKVTENFVDASGTKITPPTGFTQGNQIPMTSDTFKYTSAKALPTSYTADGKTYLFQGWYKGKTKPNTLTTSTTPTYDTTFDDNDDMTAV
ncbi:WxL domain-containing protein, partial [Enterococcus faecalis]